MDYLHYVAAIFFVTLTSFPLLSLQHPIQPIRLSSLVMSWGEMRLHFQHSTSIFLLVNSIILAIILIALKLEHPMAKPARKPGDRLLLVRKNGHDPALLSSSSDGFKSDVFTNHDRMNSSNASLDEALVGWITFPPVVRRSGECHGEAAADDVSHDHTTQQMKEEPIATETHVISYHDQSNSSKGIIPVEARCCRVETGSSNEVNKCNHEFEESELLSGRKGKGLIVVGDGMVDDLSAKSDDYGTKTTPSPPRTTTPSGTGANENTMEKIWMKIMHDKQNLQLGLLPHMNGGSKYEDLRERVQNLDVGDGNEVAVDEREAFGEVGDWRKGSGNKEVEYSGGRRRTSVGRSTMINSRRKNSRRINWKKMKEVEEMEMTSEELRCRAEDFIARFYAQRRQQSQKTKRKNENRKQPLPRKIY